MTDQGEIEMGRRWVSERQNDKGALRFKAARSKADWFGEGKQESDWIRVMMSGLILTAWESEHN